MNRKQPLQRHTPLRARKGVDGSDTLRRKTPLKNRSAKTTRRYIERRALVAALLTDRPWCEIRWDTGCQGRAVDVDEIKSRGRGGDILDPSNLQTACRYCHGRKHTEPAEAAARGVARHSWTDGEAA